MCDKCTQELEAVFKELQRLSGKMSMEHDSMQMRLRRLEGDSHPDRGNEFKLVVKDLHARLAALEEYMLEFSVRGMKSLDDAKKNNIELDRPVE